MAIKTNGIIYYKLDTLTNGYPNDITKNTGLLGEEIDGNFNFLRGHDIKSINFEEDGTLNIERYNGENLTTSLKESSKLLYEYNIKEIHFDENDNLIIIYNNGEEVIAKKF